MVVENVPAPQVGSKNILVQVRASCISAGTELAGVRMSGLPLYKRALKQPANVARVMTMMREQGVSRTLKRVKGKLAAGSPTGYSAAGVVIAVGAEVEGFRVGDFVACAGAGVANHAEFIDVPVNLAVHLPDGMSFESASTVTLGAIALQGVRRANPALGENFVVIGLGVLGQLTAQMLSANGCRVIGVDVDPRRIDLALSNGAAKGVSAVAGDTVEEVVRSCAGLGADGVIITAGGASSELVSQAMRMCRKKGRVVLVGDVGLDLKREDFYAKEIDFLISCSYGPGRYDPYYEEGGQDYPIAYVRWTENRNMLAYLELISSGHVSLDGLVSEPFPIDDAGSAYAAFGAPEKPLIAILDYGADGVPKNRIDNRQHRPVNGRIRLALVGASSFAQSVHLPNLRTMSDLFSLHSVMSRTGANAKAVGDEFGAKYVTTDLDEVIGDPEADLVMICSRHDAHGRAVIKALAAGRNVFVEKPLTLDPGDLEEIAAILNGASNPPVLMVGYNRRFSPPVQAILPLVHGRSAPMIVNYRMNAGYIPKDSWIQGPEGGGRNLGEACHIYDLFNALTGCHEIADIQAMPIASKDRQWGGTDNFVANVAYGDGSVCTLTYTALGSKEFPKEQMEIYCEGKVISMDDYKRVTVSGVRDKVWQSGSSQKGHIEELRALASSLSGKAEGWPISLADLLATSRTAFEIERQLTTKWLG